MCAATPMLITDPGDSVLAATVRARQMEQKKCARLATLSLVSALNSQRLLLGLALRLDRPAMW